MKKMNKSPLAAAMGAAVISTLSATASAEANPFGMTELNSGYMQVAAGEMNCGANMGGMQPPANKTAEGACAGQKAAPAPAPAKSAEGKCGEGKCGSMMDDGKMKKGMESSCGAMMKGKEGSCGATKKDQ
ncbi:MAG: hypothetical protein LUQ57_03450 [Methylococcaceae bacterium]|nr:hypothetical protein [Methylococcaceae bacterium]